MANDDPKVSRSSTRSRVAAHVLAQVSSDSEMTAEVATHREADQRALDIVQRTVVSLLVLVMMGTVSAVLAIYLVVSGEPMARGDVIGLWIMTGVVGLICSVTMLMINRRRPYHPLVLLGLLPMAFSWYWIFGPGA